MRSRALLILFYLCALAGCVTGFAQSEYQFSISTSPAVCDKGSAALSIAGGNPQDTVSISWSTGQTQVNSISSLEEGNYSVTIDIKSKLDTTLQFSIEKQDCPVTVSRQFTPNGDGYNDLFYINNVLNYPNFELEIFNKWGQRVHHQKGSYIPWDGRWAGTNVPDGTYYFIFFYDAGNKNKFLKGDVTILR